MDKEEEESVSTFEEKQLQEALEVKLATIDDQILNVIERRFNIPSSSVREFQRLAISALRDGKHVMVIAHRFW
jgi:hypothetical protein